MTNHTIEKLNARLSALETMFLIKDLSRVANQNADIVAYAAEQKKTILAVGKAFDRRESIEEPSEIEEAFERLAGIMEAMASAMVEQKT